jgi:hypothetical protein
MSNMSNMFTQRYQLLRKTANTRPDESGRRPSADFVARFKEQHFSPENRQVLPQDQLKKESNDEECQNNLTPSMYPSYLGQSDDIRYDLDPTPKASAQFRFTPSLLDPNSSAFAAFANQPPGYYTPTPGGSTMGFQSYELSVNNQGFGTNTPDSMTHPSQHSLSSSIFQPHLNMDHSHYINFRPHPYAQDSYQGLSIPGSAVGGAGSESSPSNYSPGTHSGAETTDPELYLATEVHSKFMNASLSRNSELYGQYHPFPFITYLQIPICDDIACRYSYVTAFVGYSSDIPK